MATGAQQPHRSLRTQFPRTHVKTEEKQLHRARFHLKYHKK